MQSCVTRRSSSGCWRYANQKGSFVFNSLWSQAKFTPVVRSKHRRRTHGADIHVRGKHASGHQQSPIDLVGVRVDLFRERVQSLRSTASNRYSEHPGSLPEARHRHSHGKDPRLVYQGYSAIYIVVTIFRVVNGSDKMPEYTKLEFIKVPQHAVFRS